MAKLAIQKKTPEQHNEMTHSYDNWCGRSKEKEEWARSKQGCGVRRGRVRVVVGIGRIGGSEKGLGKRTSMVLLSRNGSSEAMASLSFVHFRAFCTVWTATAEREAHAVKSSVCTWCRIFAGGILLTDGA